MARKKAIETQLTIESFSFPNFGVATYEGKKIKVKNAIPGQKVLVLVQKRRRFQEGVVQSLLEKSPMEIPPACEDFGICGGCTFQHISYEQELSLKKQMVEDILDDLLPSTGLSIAPAPHADAYRNKMEFSFGDTEKGGTLALGMRKRNTFYEVITSRHCTIIHDDIRTILLATLDYFTSIGETFYHKATHQGTLRHLVLRRGEFTNEIFVNLVTTSGLQTSLAPWVDALKNLPTVGTIVGIANTINDSIADVVQADAFHLLEGRDYFYEKLLGLRFKISSFSFFQTNSAGAECLYDIVRSYVGTAKNKVIFDLYCGTGTIAQLLSPFARKVIGIEIVPEATAAAIENAKDNGIDNCTFIAGDVLKSIDTITDQPDLIVLDPPREGIHPKAIEKIIAFGAKEIIYVSCKPTSLQRDLEILLANGYEIQKMQCQDLFPRTYHVETVVLLQKK